MSQANTVEAARARIQRLVDEIAALAKGDMRSEEFYQQYLQRAVAACDAKGGAVWIVGQRTTDGKSEFQLAAAIEIESSLFQTDEQQRGLVLKALTDVVQTKKPSIIPAEAPAKGAPGSLQSQLNQLMGPAPSSLPNRTPYPFLHVPLFLKEQVLGVLQVWLQPYVTRENYNEFTTFLTQLASHVEQHFQSRRMGTMVVENQRLQQLLKFVSDLAGSLDPLEVARLSSNYARDLLACERCAVLRVHGARWETLSISGQEVVEKRSTMVKATTAFVAAHTPLEPLETIVEGTSTPEIKPVVLALSKKELLALAENAGGEISEHRALALRPHGSSTAADLAYFDGSQTLSALIVQLLDSEKHVIGAILAESVTEGFFDIPAGAKEAASHRLAEWIAGNTGRSLQAALDHKELPLTFFTRRIRDTRRKLTGTRRARHLFKLTFWLALLAGILFFPWMEEVESDCTLVPKQRVRVVPEVSGRVVEVLVREGDMLKAGTPVAKLDASVFETQLKSTMEEKLAATAEAERFRGLNEPAGEQIALTRVRGADAKAAALRKEIEACTLRAPIDGIVLTKDIEMLRGVYIQAGTEFALIGDVAAWDMHIHINEKSIGGIERLFEEKHQVPVQFILYAHNAHVLNGVFKDRTQLSQIAYPHQRENALQENAFILTLPDISVPSEIRSALRPDLTGRASIELGRKPLIFLWAKNTVKWFRLKWVW